MGQRTDTAVSGSRRAAVVTLTASALLVIGGFVTLHEAGDLRLQPPPRPSPTSSTATTSTTSTTAPTSVVSGTSRAQP